MTVLDERRPGRHSLFEDVRNVESSDVAATHKAYPLMQAGLSDGLEKMTSVAI